MAGVVVWLGAVVAERLPVLLPRMVEVRVVELWALVVLARAVEVVKLEVMKLEVFVASVVVLVVLMVVVVVELSELVEGLAEELEEELVLAVLRVTVLTPWDEVMVTVEEPAASPFLMWKGLEYWTMLSLFSQTKRRP